MDETKRKRRYMQIRLTDAEYEAIEKKFRNSGLKSRSQFIITMVLQGYLAYIDKNEYKKTYSLMNAISNNINQIARRVNATNHVYSEDLKSIEEQLKQINENMSFLREQIHKLSQ